MKRFAISFEDYFGLSVVNVFALSMAEARNSAKRILSDARKVGYTGSFTSIELVS